MPISNLNRVFLLLLTSVALFAQTKIELKEQIPYREPLFLKDVAVIESKNGKVVNYLRDIKIGKKYLHDLTLTKKEIKSILKENLIDTANISVSGETRIARIYPRLTKARLIDTVKEFIKDRYNDVEVEGVRLGSKRFSNKDIELRIKERSRTFRHIYLDIFLYRNGELLKKIPASVTVKEFIYLPFAIRDIPKGKMITSSDVVFKRVKKRLSSQRTMSAADVVGKVAKRVIYASKEIRPSYIEPRYSVKKGSNVKIVYSAKGIRIELMGYALENGQIGDIIRVKNLSSNKVLKCKVLSSSSVLFVR